MIDLEGINHITIRFCFTASCVGKFGIPRVKYERSSEEDRNN
ncbi:hypothetical protein M6B38_367710 [Iris pallida]|uniref:Uncharacterized protein n=1 Tax=Iris pallida TaxID=29817 RepID=A0AAX6FZJ6_IRIPA|nr:hypothetical protein M6B38_391030 [Iris pallida]KAJ6827115.1 hypothetical protein M6B38_367710 [Iris pallida]